MTDTILNKHNQTNKFTSVDGLILDVNTSDLGNADTSYTYFNLGLDGYNAFSLEYAITATTLTFEATNDDVKYPNNNNEMIASTTDRTFASANNWVADTTGDSITTTGGVLQVTGGARLEQDYFYRTDPVIKVNGFEDQHSYLITFTIANLATAKVSLYADNVLLASGLTNGAAQTLTFTAKKHIRNIKFRSSDAADVFDLDNISIVPVAATWRDVTMTFTDGAAATITADGSLTVSVAQPWSRVRVKRVTTNATNALELRLTRMKI